MMIRKGMFIGDRYEIVDKVGSGGMSDVYKALDHKLNRNVAVKVLKDEFSADKSFVSKFKVEAQSAAGLTHPNIVNVYDVGEDNGIYYIVMELVEGITLKKYIEKKGKLSVKEAVSIAIQVAQGIEAAHNNHIIHRDIKPQNVIISREGKVKVTDFGIARAASANTINSNAMGSVHYISPEQARGGYIDEKSDIYSLGISLYEMITGKVPFEGDSTVTIALQHINEELPSPKNEVPDLPISVEKIIEKCTQKKAERRYLKVSTLIADLKKALVSPDEDFVVIAPSANTDATIMITDEQVSLIRKNANANATAMMAEDDDDDIDEIEKTGSKDEPFGDDDDIDASNPKLDRIVTISAIVATVIILIALILIVVNVLKGCGGDGEDPYETTTKQQTSSLSASETIVPNVVNMTSDEAAKTLKAANLGIKYEYENSNEIEEGRVIRQSVDADTIIDKNKTVTVYVSEGPKEFDIPSVSGMNWKDAVELLQDEDNYGLVVDMEYVTNTEVEADICIETSPKSPTKLKYGDHITLYVSSGEDDNLVKLPEMVGKTQTKLEKELTELGLTGFKFVEEYSDTVAAGTVISATRKAGASVPKDDVIEIVVSKGPQETETTTQEPTSEEPTTTVQKVSKTEVTIKGFDDSSFDIPEYSVTVDGGDDAEGDGSEEPETTMQAVTKGTLTATLIVKHNDSQGRAQTANLTVTDSIVSAYETGYKMNQFTIIIDQLDVTDVTFMLTLTYEDADGNKVDSVVYTEKKCVHEEIEVAQ